MVPRLHQPPPSAACYLDEDPRGEGGGHASDGAESPSPGCEVYPLDSDSPNRAWIHGSSITEPLSRAPTLPLTSAGVSVGLSLLAWGIEMTPFPLEGCHQDKTTHRSPQETGNGRKKSPRDSHPWPSEKLLKQAHLPPGSHLGHMLFPPLFPRRGLWGPGSDCPSAALRPIRMVGGPHSLQDSQANRPVPTSPALSGWGGVGKNPPACALQPPHSSPPSTCPQGQACGSAGREKAGWFRAGRPTWGLACAAPSVLPPPHAGPRVTDTIRRQRNEGNGEGLHLEVTFAYFR